VAWLGWRAAWQRSLYGPDGFYRRPEGPGGHFSTAAQGAPLLGDLFAAALVTWMRRDGLMTLVDVGCGRGELLRLVHRLAPDLRCVGVDVVDRAEIPDLPEPIGWLRSPGGGGLPAGLHGLDRALVLANEWLDVVPCTVAEVDAHGTLRKVLVDPRTGVERLGDEVDAQNRRWCEQYWPVEDAEPGERREIGRERDLAWADLVARLAGGVAVAVDYGHLHGNRPQHGTLTGFRSGRQVAPVPDGSCDLTAHVSMDSLGADELADQRTMLRLLGIDATTPSHSLARGDPSAYLAGLAQSSAAVALTARGGLGDFWWAITRA